MPTLDHVAIRVADLTASIAFYTEKLGLKFLFQQSDPAHGEAFAYLEMVGANLELLQLLDTTCADEGATGREPAWKPPPIESPYCPHIAFETTDLDQQVRQLRESNVPIVAGPLEIPGSVRWLYIHDPDHNIIEYIEHLRTL